MARPKSGSISRRASVTFSESEYTTLQEMARGEHRSVSQFIASITRNYIKNSKLDQPSLNLTRTT